ncbi:MULTISPECIES: hypothetical protein [unclassified Rhizobium]|uniref:hypothetical protein n=1 Tax=unclassified Rhizobium TaxID=2613769 RepID=UPI0006FF3E58|nr:MULTISPECIES: hypothetical protein [unclassified Rhizobium]KQV34597.1 hypothetical protein ASC86_13760 [Rhizobium sp. Root1212]KRD23931.1 hypothetical protein ASE37_13755 [Rhizobium sp. Root268]
MGEDQFPENGFDADWDQEFADELLGSLVVIGITYQDAGGGTVDQKHFHGYVRSVDPNEGVTIKLEGDDAEEELTLPPILDAFEPAEEGTYTSPSGQDVIDPDFVAYFTVTMPTN